MAIDYIPSWSSCRRLVGCARSVSAMIIVGKRRETVIRVWCLAAQVYRGARRVPRDGCPCNPCSHARPRSLSYAQQGTQIHRHASARIHASPRAAAARITPSILTPALLSIFRLSICHISSRVFSPSPPYIQKTINQDARPHGGRQPCASSSSPPHLRLLQLPARHFLQLGQNVQV